MGMTRLSVEDFEAGRWPRVCVLTGRTDGVGELALRATNPIGAGWLLLVLGVVPMVLYWAITRRVSHGTLPVSNAAYDRLETARLRHRAKVWLACAGLGVAVVALAAWVLVGVDSGALIVALVAAVVAVVSTPYRPWFPCQLRLDEAGRWVRVDGVNDAFAAAVDDVRHHGSAAPSATAPSGAPARQPAGWYADPLAPQRRRYWDGATWTDSVSS